MKSMKRFLHIILFISILTLVGCDLESEYLSDQKVNDYEMEISDLIHTENFRNGALEHILEGELNARGQAVGFHYDRLPSKKGKVIQGTETPKNKYGVYEAEIEVEGVKKSSNRGMSSFFPDDWTAQQVVYAINEAYEVKEYLTGNTFEGITEEGLAIRMYIDENEKIISAFPIY